MKADDPCSRCSCLKEPCKSCPMRQKAMKPKKGAKDAVRKTG